MGAQDNFLLKPFQPEFLLSCRQRDMGEDEEWNGTVKEWLIDGKANYAGFVAGKADCLIYGAAASESETADKWELIYAEPQERTINISDEETKQVHVDETAILWKIISEGTKGDYNDSGGVWFGGLKYTLVRQQEIDVEGHNVTMYLCTRPGGACCISCSKDSVVVGFSDKKKGQEPGNSNKSVLDMVGYLYGTEE